MAQAPAPTPPAPKPSIMDRLFPPLTPEQAEVLATVKLPCC
jgi:hypothetical protein